MPFHCRLIPEKGTAAESPSNVKKLVFCTGRVYYDLTKARAERKLENDIAIARIEQVNLTVKGTKRRIVTL